MAAAGFIGVSWLAWAVAAGLASAVFTVIQIPKQTPHTTGPTRLSPRAFRTAMSQTSLTPRAPKPARYAADAPQTPHRAALDGGLVPRASRSCAGDSGRSTTGRSDRKTAGLTETAEKSGS